jgi:hypothetical protein
MRHRDIRKVSLSHTWGTEPHERSLSFPCTRFIRSPDETLYRGVTIKAPPEVVFRWLCQMRVAPYSYDWIDNLGRRSPRQWTPGLDELALGQEVMRDFELADFVRDQHFTVRVKPGSLIHRVFGDVAVTYRILAAGAGTCRLVVKVVGRYPRGVVGWLARRILPWGDLIMMRRQLLNFKKLAEQTVHASSQEPR